MHTAHPCEYEQARERTIWKGALAGAAGGLVAAWAMNQVQAGLSRAAEAARGDGNGRSSQPQEDDATVKAASAVSESIAGRGLTKHQKTLAGPIVHYAFGSTMGALYGAAAEVAPITGTAWGLPFGTALWFGADEVAVPAAGLSPQPADTPASTHASALAAHLVYGATADAVRRLVRMALNARAEKD